MTHPNESVLESNGYSFFGNDRLVASTSDSPYIEAILKSANAVKGERDRIIKSSGIMWPSPMNLILTCPAFYQHLYIGQLKPLPEMEIARKWFAAYRRQKHYFIQGFPFDPKDIQTEEFRFVLSIYHTEIEAYSRAVALKAANHFVPTLRLPPVLNLIYEDLGNLAKCSRADSHRSAIKQEKIFNKIAAALTAGVPKEFFPLIDTYGNKIKLIGNAPLEWLPVRNLPLMIRYEVSRIPTTPGNVLFTLSGATNEMGVPSSAFDEILIVRSYHPEDTIRNLLSDALSLMKDGLAPNMQIRIVNVSTVEEFIEVVNAFNGMVLIYDGHGQASINNVGAIIIGGKPVDLYQFRTSLRVPSIVILSSCDTHAIDGSHASVANTFLMLGATTVLGTLLPVNAADAALFTSRLIFRISEYIPMVTKKLKRPLRWSSVISGMQKMVYITEQVQRLFNSRKLVMTPENFFPIQSSANAFIVDDDPDWYEKTVGIIAKVLNQSENATREELSSFRVVDVIKYIQLGNPDQILIADAQRPIESDF